MNIIFYGGGLMATGSISARRKKFMDYLTSCLNILDPSGKNSDYYKKKFGAMNDSQFDTYIRKFFANDRENFYYEISEYERDITIECLQKLANFMKVPLYEKIANPSATENMGNIPVTQYAVPVGYAHVKRLSQTQMKKSGASTKIEKRSALTGQVTGEDKNARMSDQETFIMCAKNNEMAMREFMGPRADNMRAKREMANQIGMNGYVSMEDLTLDDPYEKTALNTLNMYYLMQGLSTNLVTDLGAIPMPDARRVK